MISRHTTDESLNRYLNWGLHNFSEKKIMEDMFMKGEQLAPLTTTREKDYTLEQIWMGQDRDGQSK